MCCVSILYQVPCLFVLYPVVPVCHHPLLSLPLCVAITIHSPVSSRRYFMHPKAKRLIMGHSREVLGGVTEHLLSS